MRSRAHAGTVPEFEGVSLFQTFIVSAVGTEAREGKVHLAVELEFLGNDFEGGGALFLTRGFTQISARIYADVSTFNYFVSDGIGNIFDAVGEIFGLKILLSIKAW